MRLQKTQSHSYCFSIKSINQYSIPRTTGITVDLHKSLTNFYNSSNCDIMK